MNNKMKELVFYHIYPLGFCGTPETNDYHSQTVNKLSMVKEFIPHLTDLGINAVYLGPLFESGTHGYDTTDYFNVDRRLGSNADLRELVDDFHKNGLKVIIDAVFNHTGRDFFAFRDMVVNKQNSQYKDFYHNINWGKSSPYGDPFDYTGWAGNKNLVKLNLTNQAVKDHIFCAVKEWINEFNIDGLRLDAADVLDHNFMMDLRRFTDGVRQDFILLGEVVHGDYSQWTNPGKLHSVTNYECYKGLFSSHNDNNYFEIAYSLQREFGDSGIYRGLPLYNFADNHDVPRIISILKDKADIYPIYGLLFTIPGVPSIYYGSEYGIAGKKEPHSDKNLRPSLDAINSSQRDFSLADSLKRLINMRKNSSVLKFGSYKEVSLTHSTLAFVREFEGRVVLVLVNGSAEKQLLNVGHNYNNKNGYDILNNEEISFGTSGSVEVYPKWLRVVEVKG